MIMNGGEVRTCKEMIEIYLKLSVPALRNGKLMCRTSPEVKVMLIAF
jgi:hypothetical protein